MRSYGSNQPLALLRPVIMACLVERRLTPPRMRFLQELATRLGLTAAHVSLVVTEYEADVLAAQTKETGFFFGDGAFPRGLVQACLDEITHTDLQLQAAYQMMQALMQAEHTAKEVAFVEAAVGYWKINAAWHELVKVAEHQPRRAGGRGSVC